MFCYVSLSACKMIFLACAFLAGQHPRLLPSAITSCRPPLLRLPRGCRYVTTRLHFAFAPSLVGGGGGCCVRLVGCVCNYWAGMGGLSSVELCMGTRQDIASNVTGYCVESVISGYIFFPVQNILSFPDKRQMKWDPGREKVHRPDMAFLIEYEGEERESYIPFLAAPWITTQGFAPRKPYNLGLLSASSQNDRVLRVGVGGRRKGRKGPYKGQSRVDIFSQNDPHMVCQSSSTGTSKRRIQVRVRRGVLV